MVSHKDTKTNVVRLPLGKILKNHGPPNLRFQHLYCDIVP